METIRTNVVCPRCREPLCSACGWNGACEECGTEIDRETDRRLRAAIKQQQANAQDDEGQP